MNARILIVDDDPGTRRFLSGVLSRGFVVQEACSGTESLQQAAVWQPDVVTMDVTMPEMGGLEACRLLKSAYSHVPPAVIVVSASAGSDDLYRAFESGADDFLAKPVDSLELLSRIQLHVQVRTALANMTNVAALDAASRATTTGESGARPVAASQDVAAFTLAKLAETRENETAPHLARLRDYATRLMVQLQQSMSADRPLSEEFVADVGRSCPLHDIGKVGIPASILAKPGRLTAREFDIMKRHTEVGAHVIDWTARYARTGSFLAVASDIARWHHERWDGTGYPDGLLGETIPLAARIVAVADVFEALTSPRPYRLAWSPHDARQYIETHAGVRFDPTIVKSFSQCFDTMVEIHRQYEPVVDRPMQVFVPRMAVVAAT